VGTCTQHFSMTVQNSPPTCSLKTGSTIVTAVTAGSALQLDVLLTNQLTTQPLNIQSIDITWNEPSQSASNKLSWDNLGFPSGGKLTATGTTDVARSVTFTLNPLPGTLSASDAVIPKSGSLKVSLLGLAFVALSETENAISINEQNHTQTVAVAEAGAKLVLQWFQTPAPMLARGLMPANAEGYKTRRTVSAYSGYYKPSASAPL